MVIAKPACDHSSENGFGGVFHPGTGDWVLTSSKTRFPYWVADPGVLGVDSDGPTGVPPSISRYLGPDGAVSGSPSGVPTALFDGKSVATVGILPFAADGALARSSTPNGTRQTVLRVRREPFSNIRVGKSPSLPPKVVLGVLRRAATVGTSSPLLTGLHMAGSVDHNRSEPPPLLSPSTFASLLGASVPL